MDAKSSQISASQPSQRWSRVVDSHIINRNRRLKTDKPHLSKAKPASSQGSNLSQISQIVQDIVDKDLLPIKGKRKRVTFDFESTYIRYIPPEPVAEKDSSSSSSDGEAEADGNEPDMAGIDDLISHNLIPE